MSQAREENQKPPESTTEAARRHSEEPAGAPEVKGEGTSGWPGFLIELIRSFLLLGNGK